MPVDPRSQDTIEDTLESRLSGKITKLTNFVGSSFNKVFLNAFSEQINEFEIKLLAVQLSGWVDYAGGPVTSEDLQSLGLDFREAEQIEQYQEDQHLDELAKVVGVRRDPGQRATGQVTIQTASDSTQIPEGMQVATEPDVDGTYKTFLVDADGDGEINEDAGITTSPSSGNTEVQVDVIAEEVGDEYNLGAGAVTFLPAPPPGVEGVTNNSSITGGEDVQGNDSFRDDIKNAVFESSGGGTTAGIRGYIEQNVEGVSDVLIDEFLNDDPVHVDVIVDGGSEQAVLDAIDTSRPAGIRHELVRPESHIFGISVELRGTNIDTSLVQDEIEDYLFDLELSEDFVRDKLIQRIMNSDPDIENILALNVRMVEVLNEKKDYVSGTSQYALEAGNLGKIRDEHHLHLDTQDVYQLEAIPVDDSDITVTATVGGSETTLTQGTDYDVVDSDGDGELDAIDFSIGGSRPDDNTVFTADYGVLRSITDETHTYSTGTDIYALDHVPVSRQGAAITDNSGDTYVLGTDFEVIDNDGDGVLDSVDFSIGGASPDDAEDFFVDYELRTATIYDVRATVGGTEQQLQEDSETLAGDYDELDTDSDGHPDTIDFGVGGDNPDADTRYNADYDANTSIEDDWVLDVRQKVVPDTNEIEVITYA